MERFTRDRFISILDTFNVDYDIKDDEFIYVYYDEERRYSKYDIGTDYIKIIQIGREKDEIETFITLTEDGYYKNRYLSGKIDNVSLFAFYTLIPSVISQNLFGMIISKKSLEEKIRIYKINKSINDNI